MKSAPRIAIASGKGGTGKTTLAINLALSMSGPRQLLAIVGCDAPLVGAQRQPVEIGAITVEAARLVDGGAGLGGELRVAAGAEAHDGEPAGHATAPRAGRTACQPGTSSSAK